MIFSEKDENQRLLCSEPLCFSITAYLLLVRVCTDYIYLGLGANGSLAEGSWDDQMGEKTVEGSEVSGKHLRNPRGSKLNLSPPVT